MIINYWKDDFKNDFEIMKINDENENVILNDMFSSIKNRKTDVFSTIEIETINRCNNDCSFCPANKNQDIRHTTKMEWDLFKKIIDELSEMNYSGRISLFSNDEPLLDDRIFDFIEYAKKKLPNAYHSLFTNGILLDDEKYKRLINSLHYLRINNYNDKLEVNDNIRKIIDKHYEERGCRVVIEVRRKNQVLLNRGGLSPNNDTEYYYDSPCVLPFVQMVIRPDGKVSRCCQDVYGNTTLGDVNKQSLKDIWEGKGFFDIRNKMLNGKRRSMEYCNKCDISGLVNYYPSEYDYEYLNSVISLIHKQSENKKIALLNLKNASEFVNILNTKGITAECSFADGDMDGFLDKGYFVVVGDINDNIKNTIKEKKCKIGAEYIIYSKDMAHCLSKKSGFDLTYEKRIIEASDSNRLVIIGAGTTSRKLIENYSLKPVEIYDNNVHGKLFGQYVIKNPKDIEANSENLYLIAAFDYVDIVRQLNAKGISSHNIVLGHILID